MSRKVQTTIKIANRFGQAETFEVIDGLTTYDENDLLFRYAYANIHCAYQKPSTTKVHIWEYWERFFYGLKGFRRMGIVGVNCHQFTIIAETDSALYRITKAHNYQYGIVRVVKRGDAYVLVKNILSARR